MRTSITENERRILIEWVVLKDRALREVRCLQQSFMAMTGDTDSEFGPASDIFNNESNVSADRQVDALLRRNNVNVTEDKTE